MRVALLVLPSLLIACRGGFSLVGLVWLAGCAGESEAKYTSPTIERLTPEAQIVRASMALRGIRPSLEELEIAKNATNFDKAYESLVETYLASEEFGETIKDLHAELYLLRTDTELQLPVMGILAEHSYTQGEIYASTVEAPLNFVKDIIVSDRPYTEILTAQYTLADPVVADIYGLPYDSAGPEWQQTAWVDGRPLAGILSDSQIWRRYTSNASNYNRARANFISSTFLCEDIGGRDIAPAEGIDLSDPEVVAHALQTNTSCASCHSVLDPMAAFLWGYKETIGGGFVANSIEAGCEGTYFPNDATRSGFETGYEFAQWCYPIKHYNALDNEQWKTFNLPPPGYFGVPAENMTDLGELIAEDPRFAECTARNFFGYLAQMNRAEVPMDTVLDLYETLEDNDFSIKHLVKAIAMSDAFRGLRAIHTTSVEADAVPFVVGVQAIRPEQFSRTVEALTGFRWISDLDAPNCAKAPNSCWGDQDLAVSDLYGYRSLAGGVDSLQVTNATPTASPMKLLAMSEHADEAAGYVVLEDFKRSPSARQLLGLVEPDTTDETRVREQIVWLHRRILGEPIAVGGRQADRSFGLWSEAFERSSNPADAWQVLISALLQDVRMVFY